MRINYAFNKMMFKKGQKDLDKSCVSFVLQQQQPQQQQPQPQLLLLESRSNAFLRQKTKPFIAVLLIMLMVSNMPLSNF